MPADEHFEFGVSPFYFVRHGETNDSRAEVLQGRRETVLNATGRGHAETVGRRMSQVRLAAIYASPLKRAWQTASIISTMTGAPAHRVPGLMERDWGIYQGRRKELRPADPDPSAVEPTEVFEERVLAAMKSINGRLPILVVAHSGVFRVVCKHFGLHFDATTSIANDQPVLLAPDGRPGGGWHISEV